MSTPAPLWRFPGGLMLPGHKDLSTSRPLGRAAIPPQLVLPLQQHIGAPANPLVQVGDRVFKGQMLASPEGFVSAPIHASTSGTIIAIEDRPVPHPSGLNAPCIVLESDGQDLWCEHQGHPDYASLDPSALRNLIRDAGIVGLGGAGFPAFIKLNPGARTSVETLILNGAECEPFISCDDMLMRERAEEVILGARIMRHALRAKHCLIGIEDNKPEAIAAIRAALQHLNQPEIQVVVVPSRYPAGGEKQLIKALTGKEVPSQGLPIDIGVVCHNVATAASIFRAVELGEPLLSRIVTITGHAAAQPQNLEVLIGTPIRDVLDQCGGDNGQPHRLLLGGPMMGFALQHRDLPITKTANCLLLATEADAPDRQAISECIRCGQCAEVCPIRLLPQQLYWHTKAKDFDKAQDYDLFDCIECGCCSHICPAQLPLVQFYRFAKTHIWAQDREKRLADQARERHEFRLFRQQREKEEKAARHKAKAKAVAKGGDDETKKAAIQAAMERAKAKKVAQQTGEPVAEQLPTAQHAPSSTASPAEPEKETKS
ncbi:MAG: electron transport complex subunit RsxC [Chromatiales bacterium]|nr:electron transport complex subunit RsxC [Gammaproteobacteria bacterium]MBW6475560.1 electron transport complex subunit RsxC [Chromatiales bacterium]